MKNEPLSFVVSKIGVGVVEWGGERISFWTRQHWRICYLCVCMKTKLLMVVTSLLALFALNSCLQVESTITLKKDGSGTVTEDLIFGEQMVQMMQMASAQAGQMGGAKAKDPFAEMLDKKKAAERAKKMGEGVEVVSVTKIDADGKLGVRTVFKFADINKLQYETSDAMNMGEQGGPSKKENGDKPTFKYADGKLVISQTLPKGKEGDAAAKDEKDEGKEDATDDQALAMMQGMMKDMRMTLKMKFEPGIAKTNASYVDGNEITIMEIDFGKLVKDPKKLKALQGGDFEKTKKALKGIDGIKFEAKETVEVELK